MTINPRPPGTYVAIVERTQRSLRHVHIVVTHLRFINDMPGHSDHLFVDLDEWKVEALARAAGRWPLDPAVGLHGALVTVTVDFSRATSFAPPPTL